MHPYLSIITRELHKEERRDDDDDDDDASCWRHESVTSLPPRAWQLSTSSLRQPDECSEWVVTLATAMLSWPSPYIPPDSPRRPRAQQARLTMRKRLRTYMQARRRVLYLSGCVVFTSETLAQKPSPRHSPKQCSCPHARGPLGIIMWYSEENNLPRGKRKHSGSDATQSLKRNCQHTLVWGGGGNVKSLFKKKKQHKNRQQQQKNKTTQ